MPHFAYGSNLSSRFLRSHCPSARFLTRACLPNYRVGFRFYSQRRQGGISSIVFYPVSLTRGVIYEILEGEMLRLDEVKAFPRDFTPGRCSSSLGRTGSSTALNFTSS